MTTSVTPASSAQDDLLLEHQLCFALTVASRSVVGAYKPVLEKLGLTHPQYLVMLCLWEESPAHRAEYQRGPRPGARHHLPAPPAP